jgi:excisionase family DNA binding protein
MTPRPDPDRLLDVREAAAMLGVKPATLYQWAYQRRIPVVKLFGPRGALRFRRSDIEALIARSVRPALRSRHDLDASDK